MDTQVVIIADVINSRDFNDFARRRDQALQHLDEQHLQRELIDGRYAITAWDEFQVLLANHAALPAVLWDLVRVFYPLRLRLGIGCGQVERARASLQAVNEDASGQAFYLARAALDDIDASSRGSSRSEIKVNWPEDDMTHALNACLRLLHVLLDSITSSQWQVIVAYQQLQRQDAVAKQMGKTASTVSRSLQSSNYWEIVASLEDLRQLLLRRSQ